MTREVSKDSWTPRIFRDDLKESKGWPGPHTGEAKEKRTGGFWDRREQWRTEPRS